MCTYSLSEHLADSGITVNCLHPGLVATRFGADHGGMLKWLLPLYKPFALSPEKGAETLIFLTLSEKVETVSGKYWVKCKAVSSSKKSYNQNTQAALWKRSLELAGLEEFITRPIK